MCSVATCAAPALWSAATKESFDGARPSSDVMTSTGRPANFGARFGTFHVSALVTAS